MNEQRIWDYVLGAAIGAALSIFIVITFVDTSNDVTRITQTSSTTTAVVRTLVCEEDEDIVTTLDSRGLPVAFCKQVIER